MIAYDNRHDPPAPMVQITVAGVVNSRRRRTISGLLDTGSDITAVPEALTDVLQLYPIGRLQLEDLRSETGLVYTYAVQFIIADLVIPRLEVVLTGLDFVVVGRDVLNLLYTRFDGPELIFELSIKPML